MAGNQKSRQDRKLTTLDRQLRALKLRAAGCTYDQIAERLGYASRAGAHKAVKSAMDKLRLEGAEEARVLELARLDQLLLGIWTKASKGNEKAIGSALRIMERRAKLMGLDSPSRLEIQGFLQGADWLHIKTVIQGALQGHPEAAQDVAEALRWLDRGG